jgi:hypothetical protein
MTRAMSATVSGPEIAFLPTGTEPASGQAPGYYPVPSRHGGVVERVWDGDVWLDATRAAPEGAELPGYKRHVLGFLRRPGWVLTLLFLLCATASIVLQQVDPHAERVHGIQVLLPLTALFSALPVMAGFVIFLGRRVRFDRVPHKGRILAWGVLAGLVGVAVALFGELGIPKLVGSDPGANGWTWIAGPAEETGKLLIPVILWCTGRFRTPREGFLLVILSAATFGCFEAAEYGFSPEDFGPTRGLAEVMHPILTGSIAAVAWQAAYKGRTWFTGAALLAWCIAALGHSVNDVIVLDASGVLKAIGFITPVMVLVMYLLLKRSARQMVPPDTVGRVSPRWRPVAPKAG